MKSEMVYGQTINTSTKKTIKGHFQDLPVYESPKFQFHDESCKQKGHICDMLQWPARYKVRCFRQNQGNCNFQGWCSRSCDPLPFEKSRNRRLEKKQDRFENSFQGQGKNRLWIWACGALFKKVKLLWLMMSFLMARLERRVSILPGCTFVQLNIGS